MNWKWKNWKLAMLRMLRKSSSPEYLARGVALGLFCGFFLPMGIQIMVVLPLSFLLKAAKMPAVAFTFVTNHVTILFLYPLQCWIGSYLIFCPLKYNEIAAQLKSLINSATWQEACREVAHLGLQLGASFFAGGFLLALIASVTGYFTALFFARRVIRLKEAAKQRRQSA